MEIFHLQCNLNHQYFLKVKSFLYLGYLFSSYQANNVLMYIESREIAIM